MARVIFTAAVADIKGKLGGSVFQGSQYGAVLRRKVSPRNPQSSSQLTQRGNIKYLTSLWASLTAEERQSWADSELPALRQSNNLPHREISPLMAFVKTNTNLLEIGQAIKRVAPTIYRPKFYNTLSTVSNPSPQSPMLIGANATNTSSQTIIVKISPNFSGNINWTGVKFAKNRQFLSGSSFSASIAVSIYEQSWGTFKWSGKYWLEIQAVDQTTGLKGPKMHKLLEY